MNQVKFPALMGDSPLAILAAIGTLNLIYEFVDTNARLSWDPNDHCPLLSSKLTTVDAVAESLNEIVNSMPENVIIPGVSVEFPPRGVAPDKLRVKQGYLPEFTSKLLAGTPDTTASIIRSWLGSLITDLAVDNKSRGSISQYAAPAGKQSMATMLEKPLEIVRSEPSYLHEALVSWRRMPGVTGENLDHRALWNSIDDGGGKSEMRGVPGATWLALMSYPLWTTTATKGKPHTSGWHAVRQGRRIIQELRLPLWMEPLGPAAVKALIEHPIFDENLADVLGELRLLRVFHVCCARRYQPPGSQSAGVLVPIS